MFSLNCFDLKGDTLDRDNLWCLLFMVSMFTLIRTNKYYYELLTLEIPSEALLGCKLKSELLQRD